MEFSTCACSGKSLARLVRPAVMALLVRGPTHGYQLVQSLRRMTMFAGQEPDHAGLYRALKQMESEGLLQSEWDLADSGPARRIFSLTRTGRACLKRWSATLSDYRSAIDELLRLMREGRKAS